MHAFNAGHLEEALRHFSAVIAESPDSSDPLNSLSRFYAAEAAHGLGLHRLLSGDAAAALGLFERALQWNQHFPELQYHASICWVLRGEVVRARGLLESVLAQNPDHFEARILLAELAVRDGNPNEARHHLQQAAERGSQREVDAALPLVVDASAHDDVLALLQQHAPGTLRHPV
jgi:tetratricopeptide (TPR) repeat protein